MLDLRASLGNSLPSHPDVATTKLLPEKFLAAEPKNSETAARLIQTDIESAYTFTVDGMLSQTSENLTAVSSRDVSSSSRDNADA